MNKHLGNILPLFAAVVILVAVSFLVSGLPLSATTGPGERPPAGTVIPNFDGLVVRGDATVEETLRISKVEAYPHPDHRGDIIVFDGPIFFENEINASRVSTPEVSADNIWGGSIGSFYTMETRSTTSSAISATCRAGDHLTGCTAWSAGTAKYSYHYENTCWARSTTNVDTRAQARCFDPQGKRTGTNPL